MSEVPSRNCDVVMKGGITSGVVYPLAITELAKEFRFRNVGGTSAGAIAAAVTAAAEYARQSGSGPGFARLEQLPKFLAGSTQGEPNLLNLFPPTKSTRRLFAVATAFLGNGAMGEKLTAALFALAGVLPLLTILSVLPAALLPFLLRNHFAALDLPTLGGLLLVEIILVLAGVGALILGNAIYAVATLPRNRFGFSTGRAPKDRNLPGVSEWLHQEIQTTAGRTTNDEPLTFGDLWLAGTAIHDREEQGKAAERDPDLRSINLQMITTALTHGHPYRLPFENRLFAFRESEMREYFSDDVVDALVRHARADSDVARMNDPDLHALPEPWNLPIVVAARMSLSFPVLFSMVPLYAVDRTLKINRPNATRYDRCWFIDGGLSSNFPTNLFDSPLPRWPTFGINLDGFHPDYPKDPEDEGNNVRMSSSAGAGISDHWLRFPDRGAAGFGGYIGAMLDVIRNWRDNTQLGVPGYRDRIVHVKLSSDEGGLNLNMDPKKVTSLSERGRVAGSRLRERFGTAGATKAPLNWNSHRWTRYRTTMQLLQKMLRQIDRAFRYEDPVYPKYRELLTRGEDDNPKTGYWWPKNPENYEQPADPKPFQDATDRMLQAAEDFAKQAPEFGKEAPRPTPELRISPKL